MIAWHFCNADAATTPIAARTGQSLMHAALAADIDVQVVCSDWAASTGQPVPGA